jgi:hypothetical protein
MRVNVREDAAQGTQTLRTTIWRGLVVRHGSTRENGEADLGMHLNEMTLALGRHEAVDFGDLGQDGECLAGQPLAADASAAGESLLVTCGFEHCSDRCREHRATPRPNLPASF